MPAKTKAIVNGKNKVDGLDGLDTATATQLSGRGICSGITSAWILALLNGVDDARGDPDANTFVKYFNEVLRFQGAYLKEEGGRADHFFGEMNARGFDTQIGQGKIISVDRLTSAALPGDARWGAYVSLWGHAIGMAVYDGRFFLMDPNTGLLEYEDKDAMLDSFGKGAEAQRKSKKKAATDKMTLQFFTP